jgi:hypothetical protein
MSLFNLKGDYHDSQVWFGNHEVTISFTGSNIKGIEEFHTMAKEGSEKVAVLVKELDGFITQVKGVDLKDEKFSNSKFGWLATKVAPTQTKPAVAG